MIEADESRARTEQRHKSFSIESHSGYCATAFGDHNVITSTIEARSYPDIQAEDIIMEDTNIKFQSDKENQTDICEIIQENASLRQKLKQREDELRKHKWDHRKIKDNDAATKFYTGLPAFALFLWLFNFLRPKAERMSYWTGSKINEERSRFRTSALSLIDQMFSVLMRIRLGLYVQDVADRFCISTATYSKYFNTWIALLHVELKAMNPFPSRAKVDQTMPDSFKKKYPSVRTIIDCTELFIQRSSSIINQSITFSNYKHHTTIKFLVGITPSGVISFVSEGWGGRVSDRALTMESGFIELLDENDSVMADKGFTIKDLLEKKKCHLNIPPFRGQSSQFSTNQVFETQEIAELRIHVERSIGRVKNFHILQGVMPISLAPNATKIFQVCCWLSNFDVPLVKN
ncbi:hypothetical protein FSP39_021029 [Pinctada imbricata]|uniref:DDE Tnp4 domain-containing protein n=1 Tax=Pinctada imbricata TaxID=66713 RepID=A0AA88XTT5_PINIB|nr:hypothetical protein FSP39_021029 [Pinctada imbricata]